MPDRPVQSNDHLLGFPDDAGSLSFPLSKKWDHFRAIHNVSFIEAYSVGRLAICFVLHSRLMDAEGANRPNQLCTVYCEHRGPIRVDDADLWQSDGADRRQQNQMLVEVIQLRERPEEKVSVGPVLGSLVRLEPLYEVYEWLRRAREFTRNAPVEIGLCQVDGEASGLVWHLIDRSERLPCEVVKSRAEIMYSVPNDGRYIIRQGPVELGPDFKGSVRVLIDFDSVWVVTDESFNQAFKVSDVMLCPRDLQFWPERI